jgi:hypothetical protein
MTFSAKSIKWEIKERNTDEFLWNYMVVPILLYGCVNHGYYKPEKKLNI